MIDAFFPLFMIFGILFSFSLFNLFSKYFKKSKNVFSNDARAIAFTIAIYSFQSEILNSLLFIIDCQEITKGQFLIRTYLLEDCNSERYQNWYYFFVLPTFFFYSFLLPVLSFLYLMMNRKEIFEGRLKKLGFLFNGYKQTRVFWFFI